MNKISVTSLVHYLKNKLDNDDKLQNVFVTGEISNFHLHNSGHLYFTLKDEKAAISCVMFASKAHYLTFKPKNGDKVLINANTSIFETSGQLQLYVNQMKLDGIGDLFQQYEELKNKLAAEGYFKTEAKKTLTTLYPMKVAVLVGDNSAAMSDIKTQFLRRWPLCQVDYYPVLVQGLEAPKNIIKQLLIVDDLEYEAIILARGGGSFEDLFCFNNEELVKTIYKLKTFIITGIGHEQDFTLSDFVADLRAPTPTAAVELITPNISDLLVDLDNTIVELNALINKKLLNKEEELVNLSQNKYLQNPLLLVDKKQLKLDYYENRLLIFESKTTILLNKIKNYETLLLKNIDNIFNRQSTKVKELDRLLQAYNVNQTLKRGYSIISKNCQVVKSITDLKNNDQIQIKLYDGEKNAIIKE